MVMISVSLSCFSASRGKTWNENESGKIMSSSLLQQNLQSSWEIRVNYTDLVSTSSWTTYLKISVQSGWAPRLAFLVAWILQGSSMIQALGPNSLRIWRSASAKLIAVSEISPLKISAFRLFLPMYVPVNWQRKLNFEADFIFKILTF